MPQHVPATTIDLSRQHRRRRSFRFCDAGPTVLVFLFVVCCQLIIVTPTLKACLRESVDRRAVQWSDAVVVATLKSIDTSAADGDHFSFVIAETLDGPLKANDAVAVVHRKPLVQSEPCAGHLSKEDLGKSFVVLLRKTSTGWLVVTIGARDAQDPTAHDALKQLITETRKADAAVTTEQASLQARALSDADDDTEADQAEHLLLEMGPRAAPGIKLVMQATTAIGKTRLNKVLADILPPAWAEPPAGK